MDWINITSLAVSVVSLLLSAVSIYNLDSTKKALKKQADSFYGKRKSRETLPKIIEIEKNIEKNGADLKTIIREVQNAQIILSEIQHSVGNTATIIEKLFTMMEEDYSEMTAKGGAKNTAHMYIDALVQLKCILEREAE